jgi:hypothetical protein
VAQHLVAQRPRARVEHRRRVQQHHDGGVGAAEIVHRRGHHAAGPHDTAHLARDRPRVGHHVEHQGRDRRVEGGVGVGHGAGVALLEGGAGAGAAAAGVVEVGSGRVDADHRRPEVGGGGRGHAGPAAHVEHALARPDPGEGEEGWGEALAPPPMKVS